MCKGKTTLVSFFFFFYLFCSFPLLILVVNFVKLQKEEVILNMHNGVTGWEKWLTNSFRPPQYWCEGIWIAQEKKGAEGGQWRLEQQPDEANCQNHVGPTPSDARITASMLGRVHPCLITITPAFSLYLLSSRWLGKRNVLTNIRHADPFLSFCLFVHITLISHCIHHSSHL